MRMKVVLLSTSLALVAMPAASAEDAATLQLRSKAAIAIAVPHRSAPYVQPLGEPEHAPLFTQHDARHAESPSSCASQRALCYDSESGHIVYKPARQLMPGIPGLHADGLSLKRDKLVFKYTF
jgi:hypothetical protein